MRTPLVVLAFLLAPISAVISPVPSCGVAADNVEPGKPVTQRWQAGIEVRALKGPCTLLKGTFPAPQDWPDQEVREVDAEISPAIASHAYRSGDGLRQMVFSIPRLALGETAKILVTYEVTTSSVQAPADPQQLVIPKTLPAEVRPWITFGPMIDPRHETVREQAKKIVAEKQTAWEQVEALYDWVRDNITYQSGNLKGALETLKKKSGEKQDKTWVFIALCRAHRVPARTVWVPDNCFAEFYLQDAQGQGTWFPCQVEGTREFGSLSLPRPILMRGDNFRVKEADKPLFFVNESLTGESRGPSKGRQMAAPDVIFVRRLLPAN